MKNPVDRIFPYLLLVVGLSIAVVETSTDEEFLGIQLDTWEWIVWLNAVIVLVGRWVWKRLSEEDEEDEIEIVGAVASISDSELEIDGEFYPINELTEIEDLIEVGDTVKAHVILTEMGLMIVREIELTSELG